jgi:tRNA(Ile2) C34 agmatinyltransferase TiaS
MKHQIFLRNFIKSGGLKVVKAEVRFGFTQVWITNYIRCREKGPCTILYGITWKCDSCKTLKYSKLTELDVLYKWFTAKCCEGNNHGLITPKLHPEKSYKSSMSTMKYPFI